MDNDFESLYKIICNRTKMVESKLRTIYKICHMVKSLPGDVAEVGVAQGGSAKLIHLCLPHKKMHLFDTFEGIPSEKVTQGIDPKTSAGRFKGNKSEVAKLMGKDNVTLHKGEFSNTKISIKEGRFCLVHVDCDIYESQKASIEFFYPRMVPNGILIIDDYGSDYWPVVKIATDNFFKTLPEELEISHKDYDKKHHQAFVVKK